MAALGVAGCGEENPGEAPFGGPPPPLPPPYFEPGCGFLDSDRDTAATPFLVVSVASFTSEQGFNFDGENNAPRGGAGGGRGPNAEGCDREDLKYGLDAAFASAAAACASDIPLGPALGDLASDGRIELRLTHLVSVDAATDSCVGAELRIGGESGVVVHGSGILTDHVASIAFQEIVALPLRPDRVDATDPDPGTVAPLVLTIGRPLATIKLDRDNESVQPGTLLGGLVFFEDTGEGYESTNDGGFARALAAHASATGSSVGAIDAIRAAFASRLDFRLAPDGALSSCTQGDGPNAISVAIALSSEESP